MSVTRSTRLFHSIGLLLTLLIACQIKENNGDEFQKLELNQVYSFFNQDSQNKVSEPGFYVEDSWEMEAPTNYKTRLNCTLKFPTDNCFEHSIEIDNHPSVGGYPIKYCGNTNFSALSYESRIRLSFQTTNSKLGVFRCIATVVSQ